MRALKSLLGSSLMDDQTEVQGRPLPYKELLTQFIADIGGGTSDFSLIRLSPQRAQVADRRDDLLAALWLFARWRG